MPNVPPVKGGKIIGKPYQGTHGTAFNKRGGSDNWESENAVDIAVPVGTPIYAVTSGTIGSQFGSLGSGGRFAGMRLHLDSGKEHFYYAHLSAFAAGIKPGVHVTAGQLLGYSGKANGVAHLHFATSTNLAPMRFVKGLSDTPETPTQIPGVNDNPASDNASVDPQLEASQADAISQIQGVGGAPLASPPLVGASSGMTGILPEQTGADTWQLIASQGDVSPDTLRLAQLASSGQNGTASG